MPINIQGSTRYAASDLYQKDYGYSYPNNLNLRPGSKLHQKIVGMVMDRAVDSRNVMENRFNDWDKLDENLTSYIQHDEKEMARKNEDSRKPVSIVVPVSFAIEETFCTYLSGAFLDSPVFWYQGVGPEKSDVIGAILLELLVDLHCNRNKVPINLMTFIKDGIRYGFGVCAPIWKKTYGKRSSIADESGQRGWRDVNFEGNALLNIDPREYLPDPGVPIDKVQSGEFVGWVSRSNAISLIEREGQGEDLFNCRYLRHVSGISQFSRRTTRQANTSRDMMSLENPSSSTNPVDVIYMYVNLIPSEWELGDSDNPEKWFFAVASDTVLIQAKPLGLDHQMFPVAVWAPLFDGYSICPTTLLEIFAGLQKTLDFMFNSHVLNVTQAINNMFIVDPSLVHMPDFERPEAGLLIKLREHAWGRGVKDAMAQFQVNDVTRQNIQDASYITEMIQRVSGASDALQGIVRGGGERRSATEMRDAKVSALSRMERYAKILSYQGMMDIGYMFAAHTQQLMTQDSFVKAIGRWQEVLFNEYGVQPGEPVRVTPFDLMIDYDVVPKDNTMSGREQVENVLMALQIASSNPVLASGLDLTRIYLHAMRMMGIKNVQDFVRSTPVQVMPDEQFQNNVQAGRGTPITLPTGAEGMMGGSNTMGAVQ